MGVHTGDSITVAPAQTLTDREYQRLRDMARTVIQTVGVETGGSNVQFAVNPRTGEVVVIEMNPRVSRSSALASKATGFPIAKIAALLAVGYTLDEILNDITRVTPASFEPSIDYCVVKIPRWNFEKFPGADRTLGPQMKSVGEVMAIGRTFPEALNKAIRGLEIGASGFGTQLKVAPDAASPALSVPTAQRLFAVADALRTGAGVEHVVAETEFDPWFVSQMAEMLAIERELASHALATLPFDLLRRAKRHGFSDAQIARALGLPPAEGAQAVRAHRLAQGLQGQLLSRGHLRRRVRGVHALSLLHLRAGDEAEPTDNRKVIILGGGPNRIGQGIEFDYCCVHACFALKELGYETIMVNCNPETVSTDYDTADRLYFEPLTLEDVLNIVDEEKPDGVIVQFGGQTPLNLARGLAEAGVPIWGTSPDAIDLAEDRVRFGELLRKLDIPSPDWGTAQSLDAARRVAARIGYPVLVRPSYVLGGRAMEIAYDDASLADYLAHAQAASPDGPVLIDHYLEDAFELDVDAIADGERVVIAGVMQHIEEAGVHSGDSACVLPPYKISLYHQTIVYEYVERLGLALGVKGLMNVQLAIKDDIVYVLEVNPRASRTVPYVSKATGVPIAKLAAKVMAGAEAGRSRLHGDAAHRRLLRQRGGAAVPEIPGQRLPAGTGDALDRRGDGARAELRTRLRQGTNRRRVAAADIGRGADHRQRLRQGRGRQDRTRSAPAGLPTLRHARHRRLAGTRRLAGDDGEEGERGAAEHPGHGRGWRAATDHQHAARRPRPRRRPHHAHRGGAPGCADHDHAQRSVGRGERNCRAPGQRAGRHEPPGALRPDASETDEIGDGDPMTVRKLMRAMVLNAPGQPLAPICPRTPAPGPGQLLVRVHACGVCRTDLHIIDGELAQPKLPLILGHEIAGTVAALGDGVTQFQIGDRVGIPWLGWTCGECRYCRRGQENLCEAARFTGYTLDGGYADYTVADQRYCFRLPDGYDFAEAAPLLCAGLIGYRSYRMAGEGVERLGIYGFGAAAHIIAQIAVHQGKQVYAFTKPGDAEAQAFALRLGAVWAGDSTAMPPHALDAAIIFAPVGALVPAALARRRARRRRRLRRHPHERHPQLPISHPVGRAGREIRGESDAPGRRRAACRSPGGRREADRTTLQAGTGERGVGTPAPRPDRGRGRTDDGVT